jgi:deoxyadenosine/deoxycytidine kinase
VNFLDEASIPLTPAIVELCFLLCEAVYEANEVQYLQRHAPINISLVGISSRAENEGKFLIAQATVNNEEIVVTAFRGTSNLDDLSTDLSAMPTLTPSGLTHSGFLSRSNVDCLTSYLLQKVVQGKRVVITGHSLGGACATLLAVRLTEELIHAKEDVNLLCITFGAPLVGCEAMADYHHFLNVFHHFIVDRDFVPRALTKCLGVLYELLKIFLDGDIVNDFSKVISYKPFGNFYVFVFAKDGVYLELFNGSDQKKATEFFERDIQPSVRPLTDHLMDQYKRGLYHSTFLPKREYVQTGHSINTHEDVMLSTLACRKDGSVLLVSGLGMNLIVECKVNNIILDIISCDGTTLIVEVQEGNWDLTLDTVFIELANIFGFRQIFPNIPLYCVSNFEENELPNQSIGNVLPFASLLIFEPSVGSVIATSMNKIKKELHFAEDCIPIEFAFSVLKYAGDLENHSQLFLFLERLAQLDLPWTELCSIYMINILDHAINQLKEIDLPDEKVLTGSLARAFRRCVISRDSYDDFFDQYNVSVLLLHPTVEKIVYSCGIKSLPEYWTFVRRNKISVLIKLVHDFNSTDQFDEMMHAQEKIVKVTTIFSDSNDEPTRFSVKIHRKQPSNIEAVKSGKIILRHFGLILQLVPTQSRKDPPTMIEDFKICWVRIEDIDNVEIIDAITNLAQEGTRQVHVDSSDFVKSTTVAALIRLKTLKKEDTFTNSHSLEDYSSFLPSDYYDKELLKLAIEKFDHSPSKSSRVHLTNGISLVHLTNGTASFGVNSAKQIIIRKLEKLSKQFADDYKRVSAPYFCGLTIKSSFRNLLTGEDEPFFNFMPNVAKTDDPLQDTVEAAKQVRLSVELVKSMLGFMIFEANSAPHFFDTRRKNTFDVGIQGIKAAVKVVPTAFFGAYKTGKYLFGYGYKNIIDVEDRFQQIFRSVHYEKSKFSTYKELIVTIATSLHYSRPENADLRVLEKYICAVLTESFGNLTLSQLLADHKKLFHGNQRMLELLNDKYASVHLSMLKIIYHSCQLKDERRNLRIICINGETKAGKSTLVQKLFGKKTSESEDNPDEQDNFLVDTVPDSQYHTVFPKMYDSPKHSDQVLDKLTSVIDLPGCTDKDTVDIPLLFIACSNISIMVIKAGEAAKSTNESLIKMCELLVKEKNRKIPTLVCINQFDTIVADAIRKKKSFENEEDKIIQYFEQARLKWRKSSLFDIRFPSEIPSPQWQCEIDKQRLTRDNQLRGIVHSSPINDAAPLTIWLTSFDHYVPLHEFASQNLFSIDDIREWISDVKRWINDRHNRRH